MRTLPMESLSLRSSKVGYYHLTMLLAIPKKLRTLIYEVRNGTDPRVVFLMNMIGESDLPKQQNSLEALSLVPEKTFPWNVESEFTKIAQANAGLLPLFRLPGFVKLNRLRISLCICSVIIRIQGTRVPPAL
jgi:hypothetical protein